MEDDLALYRPDAWFRTARGPRYEQLYRHLSAAIAAGELPPEAQLPPERELALIADVSRVTVRKAVSQLVEDGVLEQRRGAGTFVRPPKSKMEHSLSALLSFTEYMRQRGKESASQVLRRGQFTPGPDEQMALGLSGTDKVSRIDRLRSADGITHAACNSHARRKIFEARDNHPQVASVLLAMFQELYDIEDRARSLDVLSRLNLRQQEATLVWLRMREYLDSPIVTKLLPKESMCQAIAYLNNHWSALQVYVSNAIVPIDNNSTEQLMKQVAIGRKNWRAPEVPRRTSGRSPPWDALLIMFA